MSGQLFTFDLCKLSGRLDLAVNIRDGSDIFI